MSAGYRWIGRVRGVGTEAERLLRVSELKRAYGDIPASVPAESAHGAAVARRLLLCLIESELADLAASELGGDDDLMLFEHVADLRALRDGPERRL